MKRMVSVKTERRMAKKRKRDLDEDRSQIEGVIENERMLAKDEDGFVAKYGMPSNELKEDLYDYYS